MSYSNLDDKALVDHLNKAALADRLRDSSEWRLLQEASKRILDRAVDQFALNTDPNNIAKIIELQIIIRKYKHGLFSEIEQLAQEGEIAFLEAKERGLFEK